MKKWIQLKVVQSQLLFHSYPPLFTQQSESSEHLKKKIRPLRAT